MKWPICICDHCLVVNGKTSCHCSCSGAKAGGGDNLSRVPEEPVRRYQDDPDALKRSFSVMKNVIIYTPPLGLRFRRIKAKTARADMQEADPRIPQVLADYRQAVSEQQSTQEWDIAGIRVGSGAPRLHEQLPVPEDALAPFQRDLDALDWLRVRVIIPPHEAWWAAERVVKEVLETAAAGAAPRLRRS